MIWFDDDSSPAGHIIKAIIDWLIDSCVDKRRPQIVPYLTLSGLETKYDVCGWKHVTRKKILHDILIILKLSLQNY